MKILVVAPTPYFSDRGCHVRILEEAKALRFLGHEIHICTYHLGRDMEGIPTYRIPRIPWYSKQSAGPSWHKPYLDILLFFLALSVGRRVRPDVIHAHLHEGAFLGFLLKKILRVPLVFDCQGSLSSELMDHGFVKIGSFLYRMFYALESKINKGADHIIASSSEMAQLLQSQFGMASSDVTPVVDGVDADTFCPGLDVTLLRRELGVPKGKKVIVYLGAMTEYQGIDLLLESIRTLTNNRVDFHFLLMGYPEQEYRDKAQALGISSCITFTGKIDYGKAAFYLNLGSVAVSPKLARTEANGKLYNYMACALPTVVFDTPVNREILGNLGIYASCGNSQDLAAKIVGIIDDPAGLNTLSLAVREKAVSAYSWMSRGEELVVVYRKTRIMNDF